VVNFYEYYLLSLNFHDRRSRRKFTARHQCNFSGRYAPEQRIFDLRNFQRSRSFCRISRKALIERGERSIEIDVLLMDDQVLEEKRDGMLVVLPHPYLHLRRDLLMPLTEIAPHLQHPAFGETMEHLLGAVEDNATVRVYRG
jgi:hypothetical protein